MKNQERIIVKQVFDRQLGNRQTKLENKVLKEAVLPTICQKEQSHVVLKYHEPDVPHYLTWSDRKKGQNSP